MDQELQNGTNSKASKSNPIKLATILSPKYSHGLGRINSKIASVTAVRHQDNNNIEDLRMNCKVDRAACYDENDIDDVSNSLERYLCMIKALPCPS